MGTDQIRNLRDALPQEERDSLEAGSRYWDDPKVMFEHTARTPKRTPSVRIEDIATKLHALPESAQIKAIEAVEGTLNHEILYKGVGPGDSPTYVRPRD